MPVTGGFAPRYVNFEKKNQNFERSPIFKGPDERCGGPMNVLGECGEGLRCHSDERCHGCSIDTMLCSKS